MNINEYIGIELCASYHDDFHAIIVSRRGAIDVESFIEEMVLPCVDFIDIRCHSDNGASARLKLYKFEYYPRCKRWYKIIANSNQNIFKHKEQDFISENALIRMIRDLTVARNRVHSETE